MVLGRLRWRLGRQQITMGFLVFGFRLLSLFTKTAFQLTYQVCPATRSLGRRTNGTVFEDSGTWTVSVISQTKPEKGDLRYKRPTPSRSSMSWWTFSAILVPFLDRVRYVKVLKEVAVEIPSQSVGLKPWGRRNGIGLLTSDLRPLPGNYPRSV